MSLLTAKNLCQTYQLKGYRGVKRNSLDAIKQVSFSLEKGETLAIVGESGSGKSTLARQIIGIERPTKGQVFFQGKELNFRNRLHRKIRFKNIRMVFQNPYESLNPQARVGTILDEVLQINTDLSPKNRKIKISETLRRVGLLPEHRFRYPHMFSGGQRQRIAIARAIILDPQVIIADEPLSALDVSIQAQILNLLQELQEEMGISYLFISHDLNVVEHIADKVMVMYRGRVVEYGRIEQIFDTPRHPYTQTLFASTPMYRKRFPNFALPLFKKKKFADNSGCCFTEHCSYSSKECKVNIPALEPHGDNHLIACFKLDSVLSKIDEKII